MKTLVVSTSYPRYQGDYAGTFVSTMVDQLTEAGHDVIPIVPFSSKRVPNQRMIQVGEDTRSSELFLNEGLPDRLPPSFGDLQKAGQYLFELRKVLKDELATVDLVITHWPFPTAWAFKDLLHDRKQLWVWHSADAHFASFVPRFLLGFGSKIAHWFSSENCKRKVQKLLPADAAIYTGSMPLPTTKSRVAPVQTLPACYVMTLSRLTPLKNVESAIVIASLSKVPLVVVGAGPSEHKLRRLAQELNATIIFYGVAGEDKWALLRGAQALLHTSVHTSSGRGEGAPLSVREALSENTPVVTYRQAGADDLEGKAGVHLVNGPYQAALRLRHILRENETRTRAPEPLQSSESLVQVLKRLGLS